MNSGSMNSYMFPNLLFYIVHFVLICSHSTSAPVAHALTLPVVWRGLWRTQSQWRIAWSHGKFGWLPVALLSIYIKFFPPGLLRCRNPASFRRSGGLAAARCVVFPALLSRNPAAWFGRGLAIFYTGALLEHPATGATPDLRGRWAQRGLAWWLDTPKYAVGG